MMNLNRLKGLRAEFNLNQKQVAEHLGIGEVAYLYREDGRRDFKLSELRKLKTLYKLTNDQFADIFLD